MRRGEARRAVVACTAMTHWHRPSIVIRSFVVVERSLDDRGIFFLSINRSIERVFAMKDIGHYCKGKEKRFVSEDERMILLSGPE